MRNLAPSTPDTRRPSNSPPRNTPTRQIGMRGRTSFTVILHDGNMAAHCRATDLSSTGIVLDRGHPIAGDDQSGVVRLEMYIPHTKSPVRALARPVRHAGSEQALRFVAISDADRLTIGEHLDRTWLAGGGLH